MNIGINTACLQKKSDKNSLEVLDFVVDNNFKGVEFRDEYPFFENMRSKEREQIYSRIENERLLCSVHLSFYDINIGSFRKQLRDIAVLRHQEAVKQAADLGASYVTLHGGAMSRSFYNIETMHDVNKYSSDSISLIRETCKEVGITLCVENMSIFESNEHKCYTHPDQLSDLYHQQEEQIKITFDFGHAVSIDVKPESYIEKLGAEKISFGHLSDNNFLKDQHLAVGNGSIDYVSFLKTYIKKKWGFPLFIETGTTQQALDSKKYLEKIYNRIQIP